MGQQPKVSIAPRGKLFTVAVIVLALVILCMCRSLVNLVTPDTATVETPDARAIAEQTAGQSLRSVPSTPRETLAPQPTAGMVIVGINEEILTKDWALTVTGVERTDSLEWQGQDLVPVGQWVIVWAEVRNLTTELTLLYDSDFKLTTPELTGEIKQNGSATRAATALRYDPADTVADFLGMRVEAGSNRPMAVAFDVPPSAVELVLHVAGDAGEVTLGRVDAIAAMSTSPTTATSALTDAPKSTPLPEVGDAIVMDGVTWRIVSAKNLGTVLKSDNQFIDPLKTSGMFVQVVAEVTNTGTDPLTVSPFKLIDDTGREYEHADNQWFYVPEDRQCILSNLNPGLALTCENIYEVPSDATGLIAVVNNLKLFGAEAKISIFEQASSPTLTKPATGPVANTGANLRAGPGTNYAIVGKVSAGQTLDLVATNQAGDWYKLASGPWIAKFLVDNAPADLPVPVGITKTPSPDETPVPTQPTTTSPAVTDETIIDVPGILGKSVAEIEELLGKSTEILPMMVGDAEELPDGGESRTYSQGLYTFYLFFDKNGEATGFQLIEGLGESYRLDQSGELLKRFGFSVFKAPDIEAPAASRWNNFSGYKIAVFAKGINGPVWSVQIWRL